MTRSESRTLVTRRLADGDAASGRSDFHREFGYVPTDAPHGPYPLPRDRAYEGRLLLFLEDQNLSLYESFENETFAVRPVSGNPCDCGYAERESGWFESEAHGEGCFQAKYEELRERHGGLSEIPETALKALCLRQGVPWNEGFAAAVHCTCDFDERWEAWRRANEHEPACPVVLPNFEYKPNGFWMRWPEHPILGAAMSRALDRLQFKAVLEHCERSLSEPVEFPRVTEAPTSELPPLSGEDEERLQLRVSLAEHRAAVESLLSILESRELEAAELVAWLHGYRCPEAIVDRNQDRIRAAHALLTEPRAAAALDAIREAQRALATFDAEGVASLERLASAFGEPAVDPSAYRR